MADYISKEYIINKFKAHRELYTLYWGDFSSMPMADKVACDVYAACCADVINAPAADVQPVNHGRWIEKPPYKDEIVKGLEYQIVCSECDEQNSSLEFDENLNAIGKTFYKTRYCPNCGARMDGGD